MLSIIPVLESSASTSILDGDVITFITGAMTDMIGIMTTPPLGTFITIGLLGVVLGLAVRLLRSVKR